MINSNIDINSSSISRINALVELYEGSTLVTTCTCADVLQEFIVERLGEDGKFFGTCIGQKLKIELIDLNRVLNITKNHSIKVAYVVGEEQIYPYPTFYVEEVVRDEDTNNISVTAYDKIHLAEGLSVADLGLPNENYVTRTVMLACARALDCNFATKFIATSDPALSLNYPSGPNFSGNETVREVLKGVAEVTGTVCYITPGTQKDKLVFHRLNKTGEPVLTVQKKDYFSMKTEEARTLGQLCHTTALDDNIITSSLAEDTEVQYIRENPFLEAIQQKTDDTGAAIGQAELATYLEDTMLAAIGGTSITPFYCDWNGNFLLEPGDKIALTTEDGGTVISYVLNQAVAYDGTYNEILEWKYEVNEAETPAAPATLGEVLNQTFAKVDKVDKEIALAVGEINAQGGRLTKLELDTEGLTTTVSSIETTMNDSVDGINESLETLTRTVETKVSAEQVSISIKQELENGVDKVTTSTGFTFNEEGLTVSKSSSEMSTQITEDGMRIYRNDEEMLTADHTGVNATNLHATTYLMVGGRSRFENYGSDRTGCFWIGGND